MSQARFSLTVLGIDIPFREGADRARIEAVRDLIEERFTAQKQRSHGGQSKEILLTFLALGLADDLLQSRTQLAASQQRAQAIIDTIEKVV